MQLFNSKLSKSISCSSFRSLKVLCFNSSVRLNIRKSWIYFQHELTSELNRNLSTSESLTGRLVIGIFFLESLQYFEKVFQLTKPIVTPFQLIQYNLRNGMVEDCTKLPASWPPWQLADQNLNKTKKLKTFETLPGFSEDIKILQTRGEFWAFNIIFNGFGFHLWWNQRVIIYKPFIRNLIRFCVSYYTEHTETARKLLN